MKAIVLPKPARISPHASHVLDLSRALAAGLVVLFHARIYALGDTSVGAIDQALYSVTNCGTQAVFWFFVISGYLVGGSVIGEVASTGRFNFMRYLTSRMARLYIVLLPALALGGLLDATRTALWGINAHAGAETASSLSLSALLGNMFFLQTLATPTYGSNLALWSLANEFWYYVMFPLLLAPLMIRWSAATRFALFLLGVSIYLFIAATNISMAWLFTLWCLGAVIRCMPRGLMRSPLAWSLAVAGMFAFPYLHPRIGPLATLLVGATFANALLTSTRTSGAAERSVKVAKALAGFSFSLYILHLPLMHFVTTWLQRSSDPFLYLEPRSIAPVAMIVLLSLLSYLAAFVFSRATEEHTEALRSLLLSALPAPSLASDRKEA